jgi:uncharacterized caspase-like protein
LAVLLLASGGAARGDEPIPRPDDGPRDYRAKFAIIVGINDYQSHGQGLRDLQYAANDAREFRKLLVEEFGYDDARIHYLTDAKDEPRGVVDGAPTVQAVRDAFVKWLPGQGLRADDSVLFFFAGHGLLDDASGEGYLAAANSRVSEEKETTCIPVEWLRRQLASTNKKAVPCRHRLVLLDCCYSGKLFRQPLVSQSGPPATLPGGPQGGAGPGAPPPTRGDGPRAGRASGEVAYYLSHEAFVGMTAGLGDQPVADGTGKDRHSFFTKELLQAMRERANSAREDHIFTFTELASVARPRVAAAVLKLNPLLEQIPIAGRIEPGEGDFVFRQSIDADVPWEREESRRIAAQADSVRQERLDVALLLAVESMRAADTVEARGSLERSLDERPDIGRFLDVPEGFTTKVAVGPGGMIAAIYRTRSKSGVIFFDASGQRIRRDAIEVSGGAFTSLAFGIGGSLVVGLNTDSEGGILLIEGHEKQRQTLFHMKEWRVISLAFDGINGIIVAGCNSRDGSSSGVVLLNTRGDQLQPSPLSVKGVISSVALGSDGQIAAGWMGRTAGDGIPAGGGISLFRGSDKTLPYYAVELKHSVDVKEGQVVSIALGPQGRIAAGYNSNRVMSSGVVVFDNRHELVSRTDLEVTEGNVTCVAYGPDGELAVGFNSRVGPGGGVLVFDRDGKRRERSPMRITKGSISSLAFGETGEIVGGCPDFVEGDGKVVLFETRGEQVRRASLKIAEGSVSTIRFGPTGEIAVGYGGPGFVGGVALLRSTGVKLGLLTVKEGIVRHLDFGRDGQLAAVWTRGGMGPSGIVLFGKPGARSRLWSVEIKEGTPSCVALGPGGKIAAGYAQRGSGGVLFLDAQGDRLGQSIDVKEGDVTSVAFGPEDMIAVGYRLPDTSVAVRRGGIVLLNSQGRRVQETPLEVSEGAVTDVAFGPNSMIAAGYETPGYTGGVIVLRIAGTELPRARLEIKEGRVTSVDFGQDGKIAAGYTGGARLEGTRPRGSSGGVVLFDARGERLRPAPLAVKEGGVTGVACGPGGIVAAVHAGDGTGGGLVVFEGDVGSWLRKAGERAGRNLTWAEWNRYFPQSNYRRTVRAFPWPSDIPEAVKNEAQKIENERD